MRTLPIILVTISLSLIFDMNEDANKQQHTTTTARHKKEEEEVRLSTKAGQNRRQA